MFSWLRKNNDQLEIAAIIIGLGTLSRKTYDLFGLNPGLSALIDHPFVINKREENQYSGKVTYLELGRQLKGFSFELYHDSNNPLLQVSGDEAHAGWRMALALDKAYLASYYSKPISIPETRAAKALHRIFVTKYGAFDGSEYL
jgi:hypothetical protein